jgi:hypothetical protein
LSGSSEWRLNPQAKIEGKNKAKKKKNKHTRQQQQTTDLHNIEERQQGTWDYEDDSRNVARNDGKNRTQRSMVRTSERSSLVATCASRACVTTPSVVMVVVRKPEQKREKITNKQTLAARTQTPQKNRKQKMKFHTA